MGDRGGEQIRFCLQVLCHESTVRRSDTTDLFGIDEAMFCTELLCTLDNLVSRTFTPGIDVACGEFLSEAGSPAGLDDVNDVS